MRKLFVYLSVSALAASLGSLPLSVKASVLQRSHLIASSEGSFTVSQADQGTLIKENQDLLLKNRELARKIASKLGITSSGEVPSSGSPLEQNQVLILQNQEIFKAIGTKIGAQIPVLTPVEGADQAEKNHNLLLKNRSIVVEILKKLEIPLAPPPELTGTFVEKNHTLLIGNGNALNKIAVKLDVK